MPSARSATPRIPRRGSLPSTRQTKRDLNDRSRAQALVEFVLIVPVLLLLLLMAIDFGRLFFSYVQVSNASREAASYGAVYPSDTATMTTYAQREANVQAQAGEHTLSLTTTCADSGGTAIACTAAAGGSGLGNSLTIKVTEQFTFLTPLISAFFGGHVDIASTSTTAVLGLAPNGGVTPPSGCGVPTSAAFIVTVSTLTVTPPRLARRIARRGRPDRRPRGDGHRPLHGHRAGVEAPGNPGRNLYALGSVAYECLAGRPPFLAETALAVALAHLSDEPESASGRRTAGGARRGDHGDGQPGWPSTNCDL